MLILLVPERTVIERPGVRESGDCGSFEDWPWTFVLTYYSIFFSAHTVQYSVYSETSSVTQLTFFNTRPTNPLGSFSTVMVYK